MKSLNIYLASSFKYKESVETVEYDLKIEGHNVPDKWWNIDSKNSSESDYEWYNKPETRAISTRHFQQIRKCDALILVCPISSPGVFNGAAVEVGYALALGIPVYSYGFIPRSAMYSDVIRCYSMESLIDCINIQALKER